MDQTNWFKPSSIDSDIIFNRKVQVNVKGSAISLSRRSCLQIAVESKYSICRKELVLKLTDESDPFLIYMLNLNEDEFTKLKTSQCLLVDFVAFPKMVVNLFESCSAEEDKDNPKFMLCLTISGKELSKSTGNLEIIETNPFKHLVHLTLKLNSPDEQILRKYVSSNFLSMKGEKERLEMNLENLQSEFAERLRTANENVSSKTKDIESVKSECELIIRQTESKLKSELERERIRSSELSMENLKHKATIDDLMKRLKSSEENELRLRQIVNTSTEDISLKNHQHQSDLQHITELTTKIKFLEDDLNDKNQLLHDVQVSCHSELEERTKLETIIGQMNSEMVENEDKLQNVQKDLSKANEIIAKLQSEIQNLHGKLGILNKVATKQDVVVNEKDGRVKRLENDLKLCVDKMKRKDHDYEKITSELSAFKEKFEESQKQIKTNENVISWLNKQLGDLQSKHGMKVNKAPMPDVNRARSRTTTSQASSNPVLGLPHVNLVERNARADRQGANSSKQTEPKTYQRNPLFSTGGPRVNDPFKCTKQIK